MIARRAGRVAALARGEFTPFLVPPCVDEQRAIARDWLAGAAFPAAADELSAALGGVVGASSGRAAIYAALRALELPPGSEVIVPSYACWGLVAPVLRAGLRPVFADVDDQLNLSLAGVEAATGPEVSAVITAHLAGVWATDLEAIASWSQTHGIRLIEDVAQASADLTGPSGLRAGTTGDVAVYSSGPGKLIAGAGGGWLTARDATVAERARAALGSAEPRAAVEERVRRFLRGVAAPAARRGLGHLRGMVEYRLPARTRPPADPPLVDFPVAPIADVEAQMALVQLPSLPETIAARQANAARWRGLLPADWTAAPAAHNEFLKAWVRAPDAAARADFERVLWRAGVETEALYTPLHMREQAAAARRAPLPVTERVWAGTFSVPVRPSLADADWRRIEDALSAG